MDSLNCLENYHCDVSVTKPTLLVIGPTYSEKRFDFILADSEDWGSVKVAGLAAGKVWQRRALFGEFIGKTSIGME